MRLNCPLNLADLYIRAVLTIPLTRTEKQGFKSQIGDNYKVNQLAELMRTSAKDIFEYATTFSRRSHREEKFQITERGCNPFRKDGNALSLSGKPECYLQLRLQQVH